MRETENRRILLIDDTVAIHQDFRKILTGAGERPDLERLESALFGLAPQDPGPRFELECAQQGEEGLVLLRRGLQTGQPFALAFVDMRMPPGWDGVETIERLWREDPRLQVVICTAYSDQSWEEVLERLAVGDRLLILKKPFDAVEVRQLACALSTKWGASREAELKVAQLEKLIRARDCQLENLNLDLLRARDAARAGSRVKREFLANVGHEIRTPMTTIMAMTQLALQGELGAPQRQYLETARGAAQSLMATITGILDLSVLESGRLELELTEFRLEEVLGRLARVMEEKAELKQIRLKIDAAPQALAPLVGDPYRLGQVLINLCDNAVKFSEQGEVLVRVRVERQEGERLALRFSVQDSGVGIAAVQLAQLFQPFSQLDATSTRRKGGAGMGLAIARELVELMGGELTVTSQPGWGSEFSFCAAFPRAERLPPSPAEPGRQRPAPPAQELDGISLAAGLEYCSQDRTLYRTLLVNFLENRAGAGAALAEQLAGGDLEGAAGVAHSMTAIAGTIGATVLSGQARALERALRAGEPQVAQRELELFERELCRVLASLRSHLAGGAQAQAASGVTEGGSGPPPATPAAAAREVDRAAVRELLDRMSALWERDLTQALALKELLHRELEGSVLAPEFGRMARQVEQFDFDGALRSRQSIENMLDNLGERELQPPLAG